MRLQSITLALFATSLTLLTPSLAHSCLYPKLANAYCCKTTALTIIEPHPGQDTGIHIGEDCRIPLFLYFFPSFFRLLSSPLGLYWR